MESDINHHRMVIKMLRLWLVEPVQKFAQSKIETVN